MQRDLYGLIGGVSRGTGSSGGFSQKSPTNGDNSSVMYQGAISKTSAGERNVGKGTLLLSDGYHVNVNMSHDGEMVNNDENNMARGGGRTEEQEIEESQTRFTITSNGVHGDGGRATALRVFQDQRGGGMGNDQDGNSSKQSNNNNNQYGHNSDTSSRRENMFGPDTPTGSGSSLVAGEKAQDTNKRGMAEGIEGPSHGALLDPFGQLDPCEWRPRVPTRDEVQQQQQQRQGRGRVVMADGGTLLVAGGVVFEVSRVRDYVASTVY